MTDILIAVIVMLAATAAFFAWVTYILSDKIKALKSMIDFQSNSLDHWQVIIDRMIESLERIETHEVHPLRAPQEARDALKEIEEL